MEHRLWENKILRLTFRPKMHAEESWVGYKQRAGRTLRIIWRKMGLPTLVEKIVDTFWTTMNWAIYDGDVPILRALRLILGWRATTWCGTGERGAWRRTRLM